jgi:glycosyltransferase 2 family protein
MKNILSKNKIIKLVAWSLIGILIFVVLFKKIDLSDLNLLMASIKIEYLILSALIYFLVYLLRARRFRFLLNNNISFAKVFSITCYHNFFNMVLPARIGEFSYSVMLKKESIKVTESISHIIVSRIYDLFGIVLLFSLSLFVFLNGHLKIYALLIFVSVIFGYIIFSFFLDKLIKILNKITNPNSKIIKFKDWLNQILININDFSYKKRMWLILNSLIINLLMFIFGYVLLKGLSVDLSIWAIFVGGTLSFLTTILPIQGMFNIGTMELGWVFAYVLVGMSKDQAILTGIFYHIINIVFTIGMFILGAAFNSIIFKKIAR